MRIGLTYDLKDDYLALGLAEHEVAEFDSPDHDRCDRGRAARARPRGRARRARARARRAARGGLALRSRVQHRRGRRRFRPRVAGAGAARGVRRSRTRFPIRSSARSRLHKGMAKHVARGCGVPTPSFALVTTPAEAAAVTLPLPLFAKPVAEGSSKGVTAESLVDVARCARRGLHELARALSPTGARRRVLERPRVHGRHSRHRRLGASARDARGSAARERRTPASTRTATRRNGSELVEYRLLEAASLRARGRGRGARDVALSRLPRRGSRRRAARRHGRAQLLEVNPLAGLTPGYSDSADHGRAEGDVVRSVDRRDLALRVERASMRPKIALLHDADAPRRAVPTRATRSSRRRPSRRRAATLGLRRARTSPSASISARSSARCDALAPYAVVNLVESLEGRGELVHVVPALLESLGLPFTGCSSLRARRRPRTSWPRRGSCSRPRSRHRRVFARRRRRAARGS